MKIYFSFELNFPPKDYYYYYCDCATVGACMHMMDG
jgi:hypothetical protein